MTPADYTPVPWDRVPPTILDSPAALPPPVPLLAGGDARSASASLSGPPTAPPSVLHGAADGGAADWRRDLAGVAIVVTSAAFLAGFDRLLWGA